MDVKPATKRHIEHMRRFWDETPDKPSVRPLNVSLLKWDFLSLAARITELEAENAMLAARKT